MNFKDALRKLSTRKQAGDLEETWRRWIYDLNLEINQFLASSQADFSHVIEAHPELGQLMAVLSQDESVMTRPELFRIFIDNLLWFYRPASTVSLEIKASEWARKLLRNMVIYPKMDILDISPNVDLLRTTLSTEKLLQILQRIMRNHLRQRTCSDVQSFRLLAQDGLFFLRNKNSLDIESLQTILSVLPSIHWKLCPDEVHLFYKNLDQELTGDSIDLLEVLREKFSEKYPLHVENEVVKLVWQWVNNLKKLKLIKLSSWLIDAASHNKQLFCASISILNAIFVKTGMDSTMAEFIHHFLQEIRSARTAKGSLQEPNALNSLAELYPERLSPLIYLLDVDTTDFDDRLKEQNAIFLVNMFTKAIADHTVGKEEATFILLQFPRWWNCIEQLSKHTDPLICAQFAIFWSILRGTCYIHPR